MEKLVASLPNIPLFPADWKNIKKNVKDQIMLNIKGIKFKSKRLCGHGWALLPSVSIRDIPLSRTESNSMGEKMVIPVPTLRKQCAQMFSTIWTRHLSKYFFLKKIPNLSLTCIWGYFFVYIPIN